MKIGIDVGGVIIDGTNENEDTSFFSDNFLSTPAVRNAFSSIKKLVDDGHDIFIISKCGTTVQEKTLLWLENTNFYSETGVSSNRVFFVSRRPAKTPLAKALGVEAMIDDRMDIITSMIDEGIFGVLFISWSQVLMEIRTLDTAPAYVLGW